MKLYRIALGLVVGLAAVAAGYGVLTSEATHNKDRATPARVAAHPIRQSSPERSAGSSSARRTASSKPRDPSAWAALYKQASDYYDFARAVLPAARAGDRNAQFFLSEALRVCDQDWQYYFVRKGRVRSLDEALLWASTREPAMMESMKLTYARCHEFKEHDQRVFGQANDWLGAATNAGQPVAQAVTAHELIVRRMVRGDSNSEADSVYFPNPTAQERDPRVLVQKALESEDAEALVWVAMMQDMFTPGRERVVGGGDDRTARFLAWLSLACSEGADCSATSHWHAALCKDGVSCQPNETGTEFINRQAAEMNVYDLAEQAQTLKQRIERRDWDALGLGLDSDAPISAYKSE